MEWSEYVAAWGSEAGKQTSSLGSVVSNNYWGMSLLPGKQSEQSEPSKQATRNALGSQQQADVEQRNRFSALAEDSDEDEDAHEHDQTTRSNRTRSNPIEESAEDQGAEKAKPNQRQRRRRWEARVTKEPTTSALRNGFQDIPTGGGGPWIYENEQF